MKTYYTKYTLLVLFIFIQQSSIGQELWGMTRLGGEYNKGIIFKLDKDAGNQEVVFSFEAMGYPEAGMTEYSEGEFYGTTTKQMDFGTGGIYKFSSKSGQFTKMLDFKSVIGEADGAGRLLLASNKKLYGMTRTGGDYNEGVLYEFDPVSGSFSSMIDFTAEDMGKWPIGSLVEGANGNLYGVTAEGGVYDHGVLFSYNFNTNTYSRLIDFEAQEKGSFPGGGLIMVADSLLYGTTYSGGENDFGVIYRFDPHMLTFDVLFAFDGMDHGRHPVCTLLEGSNGNLYGTTTSGGSDDEGVLFEFSYTSGNLITRYENPGSSDNKVVGSLVGSSDGRIYAMYEYADSYGVRIMEYDPGSGTYYDLIFMDEDIKYGENCHGTISISSDGKLFVWGWDSFYVEKDLFLFEYDSGRDEITATYKNQTFHTGGFPTGNLVLASNGILYGTGSRGGLYDSGVIFAFNTQTLEYTKLYDFESELSGSLPLGSLVLANDSILYGTTHQGGLFDKGVVFEYKLHSGTYIKLFDFNGEEKGERPEGSLLVAKNGLLYGMTSYGGIHNNGVMFSYDPIEKEYTKLIDFEELVTGSYPHSTLLQASDNKLYGTTASGGERGNGVFFEFDYETNQYTIITNEILFPFDLMQASNNNIYISGASTVYEYNPIDGTIEDLLLEAVDGRIGKLYEFAPNKLIGMNQGELWYLGGPNTKGNIFELDLLTGTENIFVDFEGENGMNPMNSGLIGIDNGNPSVGDCRPFSLYLNESGTAVLRPEDIYRGSTADTLQLSLSKTDFTCDDTGEQNVVLTMTAGNGVETTCHVIVTVFDTIAPEFNVQNIEVYLNEEGMVVIDPEDVITGSVDACGIDDISIDVSSFSCSDLGDNLIELAVTDINGNKSMAQVVVTVHDTIMPEIGCHPELVRYVEPYQGRVELHENEWKISVSDNCNIESLDFTVTGDQPFELTSQGVLSLNPGIFGIEWTAIDQSGRSSSCMNTISINKRPTTMLILDEASESGSGKIILEVMLMDNLLEEGVEGRVVTISNGAYYEEIKTNDRGVARAELLSGTENIETVNIIAKFEGDETYDGSTAAKELITGLNGVAIGDVIVYPNPFSDVVYIEFRSPDTGDARLDIFDAAGRKVTTILNHPVFAGEYYQAQFRPDGESGGMYIYRLSIGSRVGTGKINSKH